MPYTLPMSPGRLSYTRIAQEAFPVQPMTGPAGALFYMNYTTPEPKTALERIVGPDFLEEAPE